MNANEAVVITGIAGRIAAANSVDEFEKYLYGGVDLVCEDNKWPKDYFGISNKIGRMTDFTKFDAEFFGINDQEADLIDPQIRILIEVIFECICDAGETRERVRGSRTGIYFGSFFNEIDRNLKPEHTEYLKLRQTFLGWLSYALDITGPCYMYETACSSSCTATVEAFNAFNHGLIDYAIIATSNTNYSPSYAVIFQRLGLVSTDGKCRFLDANASGYVKSDAVTAFLLQRESSAKRIYARILGAVTTADGYKSEGITYPKWTLQRDTIQEAYNKAGINPLEVDYVEAHGTGTQVGDAQEVNAIYEAFKIKDRKRPLLLGSVKTNVGHSEGSSGLTALLKVIFTFKNKCIPQSIHYKSPNMNIKPLIKGEVVPVITNTPFCGDIIGVNSFGFGGSNCHLIVGAFRKQSNEGNYQVINGQVSRLVLFCGRTEERVEEAFDAMEQIYWNNQLTREYLSLVNDYSKMTFESGMKSRGYLILNSTENIKSTATLTSKRPLYVVFGGLGQQLKAMATPFMRFDAFAKSIKKSVEIVDSLLHINLMDILVNEHCDVDINKSIISLIPIAAFQVAMIDLFTDLGIQLDGYFGHSFGEFACGYLDGAITQKQYLLAAIAVYKCTSFKGLSNGLMAATDLSREELTTRQLTNVYLACDNSAQSTTVAGKPDDVTKFVEELQKENRFVRMVKTGGIAFHCPVVDVFIDTINNEFKQILTTNHKMSTKWISTSIKNFTQETVNQEVMSTYFTRCVSGPVYFRDAINLIPSNAVVVEISARKFMAPILTRTLPPTVSVVNVYNESGVDNGKIADRLLSLFGNIYEFGFNVNIEKLYPSVSYPFDCTTPSLSSIIKLDHSKPRLFRKFPDFFNSNSNDNYRIDLSSEKWSFLTGHRVNGEIVMPLSMYIYLIWDFFSTEFVKDFNGIVIAFEDIHLHQEIILAESKSTNLNLSYIEDNGKLKFAVKYNNNLIITAFVRIIDNIDYISDGCDHSFNGKKNTDNIYGNLTLKGYELGEMFKQIHYISNDFTAGNIKWDGNFVTFLESVFHMQIMADKTGEMITINHIDCLQIDAKQFKDGLIHVHHDKRTNETFSITQSSNVSLLIRSINYESANTSIGKQLVPQISTDNEYLANYVSADNSINDVCSILGVSGRTVNNQKFVSLVFNGKNKKDFKLDPLFTWIIPESFPLPESAAITYPYCVAYYSLFIRGHLKTNETILVLNAWSPIGIATISICLSFDCDISATVDRADQRMALKSYFSELNMSNIYLSKSNDLEEQMMRSTNGNGFDLVLSTNIDHTLQANLRLIALNGRYLQVMLPVKRINAILGLQIFLRNIAVHGIQLSSVMEMNDRKFKTNLRIKQLLHQLMENGIKTGVVRHLPANGFLSSIISEVKDVKCLNVPESK